MDPTFRIALAILGNEADARDATQDVFLRAWRSLPSLRDPALFPAWFGRIVVNTCRTAARSRGRQRVREIPVEWLDEPTGDPAVDGRIAEIDAIDRALDRLSGAERTLLALHHYRQMPLAEIGDAFGISEKTVKSRLFSARRALERALEDELQ
jgi:RNA polymerase sigma-70 factor (ECF subfamily)